MRFVLVSLLTYDLEIIRSNNRGRGYQNSRMQNKLIDFINRMASADSFDEKWNCLTDNLFDLGFNVVNYTVFPRPGSSENPQFIENFKNNWVEHYTAQEYGPEDALIPHVLNSDVPALMLSVDEQQPLKWSAKGMRLISEAKDAGMERAVGFSHKNSDGLIDGGIAIGTSLMSARDFRAFIENHIALLHAIYSIAYQNLHPECRQRTVAKSLRVSPRQYDLLMALWDGLSNKQIADRLRVSEVTVSFHLRELRKKIGCRQNREIIPRAYSLGLLGSLPKFIG